MERRKVIYVVAFVAFTSDLLLMDESLHLTKFRTSDLRYITFFMKEVPIIYYIFNKVN